ncbi:molybdopterin biosynthesis protein [Thermoplasma sp.]|uniref:molybdopterin biosynthesis protein n=1 Tax=Thermoplasma sp. TaxID=1973142 RepID=UPI0026120E3E|nr:molybdopterin biosynthesis protein [Thermoplasma sp.]
MKVFHRLVSAYDARTIIAEEMKNIVRTTHIPIEEAEGRVVAEDIFSQYDVPPFDRSEVDGFAVDHSDVEEAREDRPVTLKIAGSVSPGESSITGVEKGTAVYIATGAIMPKGADAVVMVEDTRQRGDQVDIYRSVYPGENVAFAGTDISLGEIIATSRTVMTPERLATLAASGVSDVTVFDRIRIGVFSTGNEIVKPGTDLKMGQIFDVNGHYFQAKLNATGLADTVFLGYVGDREEEMISIIKDNLEYFDILMASGSTSAGFYDMLYRVIESVGGTILFHGINMRPGKPTFFGKIKDKLFIGMPGFPLSSAIILNYIVIPAMRSVVFGGVEGPRKVKVPIKITPEHMQETVYPVIITRNGTAFPIMGNSGSISRLRFADGLISIPGDVKYVDAGETVDYYALEERAASIISIGSSDPLLDIVVLGTDRNAKIVNMGSWGGINAMRIGVADVSGIHILRGGTYNIPVIDEDLKKRSVLIRGFNRNRGFLSRTGIGSFDEIIRNGLTFVNRNKGSGTRDLIEEMIGNDDRIRTSMRGYLWESPSEAGVAQAIAQGRADAGIGLEFYAIKLGLQYKHIKKENYDILVSRDFYESETGRSFIKELKALKGRESQYPGYEIPSDIGEVIL